MLLGMYVQLQSRLWRVLKSDSGQGELVALGIVLAIVVAIGIVMVTGAGGLSTKITAIFTNLGNQLGG